MKWHFANVFATYLILYKLLHELVLLYRYQDLQIYIKCWTGGIEAIGTGRNAATPVGCWVPSAIARTVAIASSTGTTVRDVRLSCPFPIITL